MAFSGGSRGPTAPYFRKKKTAEGRKGVKVTPHRPLSLKSGSTTCFYDILVTAVQSNAKRQADRKLLRILLNEVAPESSSKKSTFSLTEVSAFEVPFILMKFVSKEATQRPPF